MYYLRFVASHKISHFERKTKCNLKTKKNEYMKTRLINFLFASIAIVLGVVDVQAQTVTWTGEAPAKGSFYIFSNSNVYLSPNTGTAFCVSKSSIQDAPLLTLGNNNSPYTITENEKSLGCTVTKSGSNYSAALNTTETRTSKKSWTFTGVTGGYRISNVGTGGNANGNYNKTNYLQYSGGKLNPTETANNAAVWTLVSQEQYNAFSPSKISAAVGAKSANWQSNISTSKENGVWVAKSNADSDGEYLKLNLGVANGYYLVTIVAKKAGSAQAAIVASSGTNVNSTYITTSISTYELPVKVTDGNIFVFVRSYGNAGDVYAMVTKVLAITESVFNSKNIGPWISEAPAAKEYFIFHPNTNKFMKATSKAYVATEVPTLFTLSAATNATISYQGDGETKYVYESEGNASWGDENANKWKIESNNGGYYIYHQDPGYRWTRNRYINYDGTKDDLNYPYQNFVNNDRTWQFISNSQFSAIYPTNYVRGLLRKNTVNVERSGVSLIFPEKDGETWLAKTAASTSGEYLTLNFTGLADGYYQVDVDVKKSGSGTATINAEGATTDSKNIGTTLSTQTLKAQVTGGKLSVYVNAADANCGNVYAAIKNIKEIVVIPDNSKYYFYNVESGKYLEAGANWGTKAVIGHGIEMAIRQKDVANGIYTISTLIDNKSLGLSGGLVYTDQTADIYFEKVGDNTYTLGIGSANNYLTAQNGTDDLTTGANAATRYAHWILKTEAERIADLAGATKDNGVDATFLVKAPGFGRLDTRNTTSWTGYNAGVMAVGGYTNGADAAKMNFNLKITGSQFDIYQQVAGVPNGLYVVTMQGLRTSDSNDAELYVNDFSRTIDYVAGVANNAAAYEKFATGGCKVSLPVKVTDGTLKIGARSSVNTGDVYIDNFEITYYGAIGKFTALPDNLIPNPGFQLNTDHTWNASWSKGTGNNNKTAFAMQVYDTKDEYFDVNKGAYAEMRGINSQVAAGDINQTKTLDPGFYTLTADVTAINREGVLYASVKNGKVYSVAHNGDRNTVSVSFYVESRANVTVGYKHEAKTTSNVCIMAIDNVIVTKMPEPATTAFTPASMTSPWVEVTSTTSDALVNPNKYLFAIWADNSKLLALGNGTNAHQGTAYKTMVYKTVDNPISDLTNLWEFYKSNGKYVIASASDREHILQTNDGGSYLRYQATTPINVASGEFLISFASTNNNVRFVSDNGGICQWSGANEVAIKEGFSHYKLYAISRADYYAQTQKIKYNATTLTPIDVSLFLANPEGLGTSGDGSTMLGWTRSNDCTLATYEDAKFAIKSGKSYFGYYSNDVKTGQPKGKMYQTISGLPAGYYVLSVKTDEPQTGVSLYMGSFSEALTSSIDNEVTVSGSVATDGGSLTFGIQLEDYQPHVDSKDQPDYYQLMFDKFVLKYYGTDEVLAETVGEGEYYIRTNIGTDANPEYRYLEAGGNSTWGTEPVIGDHGFAYKLEKNGTKAGGVQLYALNSFIKEKTASQYFNGYFNDRNKDRSLISFIPVDAVNNPLDYRIYTERNVISDGTVCEAGYLYPKNNNTELGVKADNSGATVWQVVNELQRIKEMSNASMSNPVDATFFIKDPDFSRNDTRSGYWKVGNNAADTLKHTNDTQYAADYSTTVNNVKFVKGDNGQNNTNFNVKIQANKGAFDLRQKIQSVNLPTGIYRISAQGAAGDGGNVTLYAADGSGNELGSVAFDVHGFGSNKAAADEFNMGSYKKTIVVVVEENGLTIGFRGTTQTATSYVDNVEMEYLGEKPIDPADLTDERDVYVYNVEAGAFLTQYDSKNSTTGVVTSYAIVGTTGYLWTIKPKDGEAGKIAIKHGDMYLVPSNTTSTAIGLQTMVKAGDPYYWTATVDPVNPNCMIIKDDMGRLLEWNGDKAYNVLSGTSADIEPRGTRWQLYTASQYGKDRAFASTASASRLANWPIVRAARVNIKNLVGDNAIEGLSDSYTAMDAVWQNIHSSSSQIASAANEVKARIVAAQNAKKGDVRNPIDVSFLINNANLGEGSSGANVATGWTVESGAWSAVPRAETIYPNKKDMINIGRFLWATSASVLKQTVSNLPSGTYKLAVDVRGRTAPSVYNMTLVPSVSSGSDGREGTFSESSSIKFGIKEVVTKYVVIKDDDATKNLTIRFALESGSVAFDNFRLLYCGKVTDEGDFRLIKVNDNTEIELQGTWDITNNPELGTNYPALKDALSTNDIGAIHVYNENATVVGDLDLYNNYIKGTNTVVYTDINNVIGDANVIRRDKVDTVDGEDINYSCNNLVLTYKQGVTFLSIPYGFRADNVTFNRPVDFSKEPYKTDGFQWTNIVVPFDITSRPIGVIDFYKPMSLVDWDSGKTTLRVIPMNEDGTLEHNTPALVKADGDILIKEKDADVYPTSELEKPRPDKPGMNLFGNYTKKYVVGGDVTLGNIKDDPQDIPNTDGLHANRGYYTNSNKFKNGNGWFNIGAFQAFIYDGSSASAASRRGGMSFDIEEWFNTEVTEIADVEDEEVKVEAYYSVNGIRLDSPQKGVNIVKFSNGMKKKIFIK